MLPLCACGRARVYLCACACVCVCMYICFPPLWVCQYAYGCMRNLSYFNSVYHKPASFELLRLVCVYVYVCGYAVLHCGYVCLQVHGNNILIMYLTWANGV